MKGVKVLTDKSADFLKAMRKLTASQLLVGIPAEEAARKNDDTPMDNATLGFIHEYGSPAANIPARPVLIPGVEKVSQKCADIIATGAADALTGGVTALEKAFTKAGLLAQASVRATLTAGEGFEPLAESTLKAREAKGFKGTKPLIRTGQLRNSYTFVVRKRG